MCSKGLRGKKHTQTDFHQHEHELCTSESEKVAPLQLMGHVKKKKSEDKTIYTKILVHRNGKREKYGLSSSFDLILFTISDHQEVVKITCSNFFEKKIYFLDVFLFSLLTDKNHA